MHCPNRLLLSLIMIGSYSLSYAEHISLPTMSVKGVAGEDTLYTLPITSIAAPDLGDWVKRLPGTNINKNGPLTSIVQYRGLFGDRVNVLIDDVRISQAGPNRMDPPLNHLPSSRIADIALYRGIAPVSSGIETVGGTIMVHSKKAEFATGDETNFHGNASAGYASSGNTHYTDIMASIANQTHRLQATGGIDSGDIESNEHKRDTLSIHYGSQKRDHKLEFDIEHHDIEKTSTPALPMDIVYARGENYKIKFSKDLDNNGKISAQLNYQNTEHQMANFVLRSPGMMSARFADTDVESFSYYIDFAQSGWRFGLNGDQAEHNADIFDPNNTLFWIKNYRDIERARYSAFTEWTGPLDTNWTLATGLRITHVETDADTVGSSIMMAPNIVLRDRFNNAKRNQKDSLVDLMAIFTRKINDDLNIEFGLARKERAPSYQERYLWMPLESTSGLADGNNYVGNIDLYPETAYQAELGFAWHIANVDLSPRVFYHHINNYIQGITSTDMTVNMLSAIMAPTLATPLQFSNVGAKLYGFDANWFAALTSKWQLNGTISYVRGQRRDSNDNLYRIAPPTARTMLSYVQTTWRVGVEVEVVAAQNNVSSENNEQKTAGYVVSNIVGSYQPTQQVTLSAGINNVFNRDHDNHLGGYYRIGDNPDIAQGDRIPGLDRSAYVAVSINW